MRHWGHTPGALPLGATDFPTLNALAQVCLDMLQKAGRNVADVSTDWGSIVTRRANKNPPDQAGWNIFLTVFTGLDFFSPAGHLGLRGNGQA